VRDTIIFSALALGIILTLRRPWVGALLWTWISVMNPHRFGYLTSNAPVAAVAAGVTLFGLMVSRERKSPFVGTPVKWLVAFMLWMTLSWLIGYGMFSSDDVIWIRDYDMWKRVMKTFFMVFVTLALLNNRHQIVAFVWVAVMSLAIIGAKGGVFTIATLGKYIVYGPPGSFMADNNEFALALVTIVPLLFFLLTQIYPKYKKIALCMLMCIALCAVAAIGSWSRGGLVAMVAMGVLLWWRAPYKGRLALLFLVGVVLFLYFMPEEYRDRMMTMLDYKNDESSLGRIRSWMVSFQVATHHVTGAGMFYQHQVIFSKWDYFVGKGQYDVIAAHSIYFQVLGNHGFIGLFLYLMIGVTTYRSATWLRRNAYRIPEAKWAADLGSMVQVSMVGFAVGGAFLSLAYADIPFNMMVMVVLARHWVETKGWERDPKMGFFEYCLRGSEPRRSPAVRAAVG